MAYSKKIWKARQGLGLNKFSIDGATPVPITNQPDSITQQGDALSAGNLNNLEDRIADAFDDVETSKADKATTDDLQNQIVNLNTDVATLDAIVGGEAEIENTDPSEGQSILASSRLIHHVNLLPSGEFGLVGARDIAWNNFVPDKTSQTINGITFTVDNTNHTITMSGTATANASFSFHPDSISTGFKGIVGHKYLLYGQPFSEGYFAFFSNGGFDTSWQSNVSPQGQILTCTDSTIGSGLLLRVLNGNTINRTVPYPVLRDLTTIYGSGNEPTSVSAVPAWMLKYTPYDAGSIINLNPTGFSIRGVNLWDEETELGALNGQTGGNYPATDSLRSANYIPVTPSTVYYGKIPVAYMNIYYYRQDKSFIGTTGRVSNSTFTTPSDAYFIRIEFNSGYGTSYNHDVQIADNTLPTAIKTTYHPSEHHTVETPQISDGHYVNENVFDYVTNKVVDGVLRGEVHTRGGVADLSTLNWTIGGSRAKTTDLGSVIKVPASGQSLGNYLTEKGYTQEPASTSLSEDGQYAVTSGGEIIFYYNGTAPNGLFYYELASETVTYGEPLRSFSLTDYATIEPITPQTIPNRIEVPFSVLSKSNNGLIEQIRTNTADIADNKAVLAQHEARIANLEQISGEYVTEDLQDYSIIQTGKASYALVETLKGVSRVENNIFKASDMRAFSGSVTVSDGLATWTGDGIMDESTNLTTISGHVYLLAYTSKNSVSGTTDIANYHEASATRIHTIPTSSGFARNAFRFTSTGATNSINFRCSSYASGQMEIKEIVLTDLTQYFNGNIPSNADTVAHIAQYHPELLEARDYNAGEIKNSTYTKVTSLAKNLYSGADSFEVQANGTYYSDYISVTAGQKMTVSLKTSRISGATVTNVNLYPVIVAPYIGSTEQTRILAPVIMDFPSSGTVDTSFTFTVPTSVTQIRFYFGNNNGDSNVNTLKTNFFLEVGESHFSATLTIPSVTLKGAGSVSEVYDLETGEVTHPLRTETFNGTEGWLEYSGAGTGYNGARVNLSADGMGRTNIINNRGFIPQASPSGSTIKGITTIGSTLSVTFSTTEYATWSDFVASFASNPLVVTYALVTPDPSTFVTPVLNNTLKTEGGGTVYTDADVDGQFTMGFLNL